MTTVKQGALVRLVEYLVTRPNDELFESVFFLNYRVFTSSLKVFGMLRTLFHATAAQAGKLGLVLPQLQSRVLDLIGGWVSDFYYDDFVSTPAMARALDQFVASEAPAAGLSEEASMLRELRDSLSYEQHAEFLWPEKMPDPVYPDLASGNQLSVYSCKDVEIARQLTVIESGMFHAIRKPELVDTPWMSEETSLSARNVIELISFFNRLYLWVTLEVIKPFTKAERARAYDKMVGIMGELYKMRNYNATMAIVGALNSAPILRLAHTRKLVSSKARKLLRKVEAAMSTERNYGKYRAVLNATHQAVVPYLWLTLHDLVLAKDGNAQHLRGASKSVLSMARHLMTSKIIDDGVLRFQQYEFNYEPIPAIQALFTTTKLLDEDAMYEVSLKREPRGADAKDVP